MITLIFLGLENYCHTMIHSLLNLTLLHGGIFLTPHQEIIRGILINRFLIPPDNINPTELQQLTPGCTLEQVRKFAFSTVFNMVLKNIL